MFITTLGTQFRISTSSKKSTKMKYIKLSKDARLLEWPRAWFKGTKVSRIDLTHIIRIQNGQHTIFFEKKADLHQYADLSFSLIYGNGSSNSVDFIAPSAAIHQHWYEGLKCLIKQLSMKALFVSPHLRYVNAKWDLADRDGDGSLTKKEILALVPTINISMSKSDVIKIYNEVDRDRSDSLNYQEFCEFMRTLCRRCVRLYVRMYAYTYVCCMFVYLYVCIFVCVYICMCVYLYVVLCLYVCMIVCLCVFIQYHRRVLLLPLLIYADAH